MVTVHDKDDGCVLLNGSFAVVLQFLIGMGSLSSLAYKRYYVEREPHRTFQVWIMDVSKQVVQSVLVHFFNIGLAVMIKNLGTTITYDECAFYFISVVLDTIVGVALIWAVLTASSRYAQKYDIPPLKSHGYYGEPPQMDWYFMQLGVFIMATVCSKTLLATYMILFSEQLGAFGDDLFSSIQSDPDAELTLVMVVGPFFMSIVQYWIVDTFLMDEDSSSRTAYDYIDDEVSILSGASRLPKHRRVLDEDAYFRAI